MNKTNEEIEKILINDYKDMKKWQRYELYTLILAIMLAILFSVII